MLLQRPLCHDNITVVRLIEVNGWNLQGLTVSNV